MGALKWVLRYLSGTRSYGITYFNTSSHITNYPNHFYGFADAAFANQDDFKLTSGYVFLAAGGVITWRLSKRVLKVSPELRSVGGRLYKTDVASTLMLRPCSLGSGDR